MGKGAGFLLWVIFIFGVLTVSHQVFGQTEGPVWAGKKCEIWDDPQGIPHIRAADEELVIACWGYVQARDRIWEMDWFRRATQGRRAEIAGVRELKSDFIMRILDLSGRARTIFNGMSPAERRPLQAFSFGVNRGLKHVLETGGYEFKRLGYEPEPWQPWDSIALALLQAFDQTKKTFGTELFEEEWKKVHGSNKADDFKTDGLPWDTSILKEGEYVKKAPISSMGAEAPKAERESEAFSWPSSYRQALFGSLPGLEASGSNSWVVAPERSATGKAWLANDPHLKLHYPPVWHWAHVEGGRLNAMGAAFVGIPMIVSGANTKVSWGVTNSYLDVGTVALVSENDLRQAKVERPTIWFRFMGMKLPFFFKSFEKTSMGDPVLPLPSPKGKKMVVHWSGFRLDSSIMGQAFRSLFDLMAADSTKAAAEALKTWNVPTWNFVFADQNGEIGYRAVGKVPRAESAPRFGIDDESLALWEKRVSQAPWYTSLEMPNLLKPPRGFIVTANNRHWPVNALFHGGRSYQPGFRGFRIEELLLKTPRHGLESMREIQCDLQAVDARFFLPRLLAALNAEMAAGEAKVLAILKDWGEREDFRASLDCRACGLYRRWQDRLEKRLSANENALYRWLENPSEDFKKAVNEEFVAALGDLKVKRGSGELPTWKTLHENPFPHLIGDDWFGGEAISTPGDDQSVNPGTSTWERGRFVQTHGASQRLVVEMTSPPTLWSVLPGENQDREKRELSAASGPWMDWLRCRLQKREFPVNWKAVQRQTVTLFF